MLGTNVRRRVRIPAAILISAAIGLGSVATAPPASATITSPEYKMIQYINASRAARGLAKLKPISSVSDLARAHSRKMAAAGKIFHSTNLAYTLRNYSWSSAGENVGRGGSIYSLHRAFMNSAGHRANILFKGYKRVGVGVVAKGSYLYVTVMFLG